MRERERRWALRRSAAGFATAAALVCACAGERGPEASQPSNPAAASAGAEDARIAEIEAAIGRDRATLRRLVSEQSGDPDVLPLHANPEVELIARRLPALQQELRELRRARASHAAPPQPN